jgi:hypothetical protein
VPAVFLRTDDVLRRRPWTTESAGAGAALWVLAANLVVFGMIYGAVMGSFGGVWGDRFLQVVFAAVKVPLLLLATSVIALPSFFVLNTLLGLRRDFVQAVRALVATQAGLAIVLASLAPLTAFWYASSGDYPSAIRFNALMFATASLAAQWLLRGYYRPLIRRNHRHRWMLYAWLVAYIFVGIQMGWILRPFVGSPGQRIQFFREDTWGNAYVVVAGLIRDAFAR